MRLRFLPRSLSTQIALLVAVALFVAQAINFALLVEARRQIRLQQVVGPVATRIIDAEERIASQRPVDPQFRGRIVLLLNDPIPAAVERQNDVETKLKAELAEAGVPVRAVHAATRFVTLSDPMLVRLGPRRARYLAQVGSEIVISVQRQGGGWMVVRAPWPRGDIRLLWPLFVQTLVLYVIVLVPVLWAGRHVSKPMRSLTLAARGFKPGEAAEPVIESGPQDLRDVIAAFNALRLRVTAMLEEKDRMLGAIGHDLRTPLAALRVRIESVDDDHDRAKMAETIAEMNRTLDDILSLARLGRPSEPVTEVDLGALIDAVVEDFRDIGDDVHFDPPPRLTLRLRPSLTRRAVRNLIENAIKYAGSATVSVEAEPHQVAIVIADDGPGIDPDKLEEVFDPFTRLEASRNRDTGGAGLGLALARAIVRDAGGEIVLANRPTGGLAATIRLPRPA